jgi:hypothetical protein
LRKHNYILGFDDQRDSLVPDISKADEAELNAVRAKSIS